MWWMLLLQIVLIGLNAVFACAEIAVLSVNERKMEKLAEKGNKSAGRISGFLKYPEKFLATIQVAITLSGFLGSAFAADNFAGSLTDWILSMHVPVSRDVLSTLSVIAITLILSYFTLVFGELVPKRLAMRKSESLSLSMSGFLKVISVIFKPLVWLLSASTNGVLRLLGIDPNEQEEQAGEEEILLMVDSGKIEEQEKQLIANVFEFNDVKVREICTHRKDVDFLKTDESIETWETIIHKTRHSLYPVRKEDEEIIGILDTKDFFRMEHPNKEEVMKILLPVLFVPENARADDVLALLKKNHAKMAVTVDEYGGIEGVVTLQDLAEAIIGDMEQDEEWIEADNGVWKVYGNVPAEEVEAALQISLTPKTDTFTGWMMEYLGQVIKNGDTFDFEGFQFKILKVEDHVAVLVHIEKIKS